MNQIVISDDRMDELISKSKRAAIVGSGGGDGSPYRERFNADVYRVTLDRLIANEREEKLSSE